MTKKMNFDSAYIDANRDSNEARLQERVTNKLIEATLIFEKLELWDEVENLEEDEEILNWFLFDGDSFDLQHLQNSKVVYADSEYGIFIGKTSDWSSFIEFFMNALYN